MQITKLYENTTAEDINVNGVGTIPAGERLSVTSEYPTPVNLANYPGVAEVGGLGPDEHQAELAKAQDNYRLWREANPSAPTPGVVYPAQNTQLAVPGVSGGLDIQKQPTMEGQ